MYLAVGFVTAVVTNARAAAVPPAVYPERLGRQENMSTREAESFPSEVEQKLKTYVYRLIDPRNGETFYVGKGKGNRVFAHIRGVEGLEDDEINNKLKRIRQIQLAGFEVAHVIHRHGMDDATAFEVEAALMDAYRGSPTSPGELAVTTGPCTPMRLFAATRRSRPCFSTRRC